MQNSASLGFFVGVTKLIKFIQRLIPCPLSANSRSNGGQVIHIQQLSKGATQSTNPANTTAPAIQSPLKQESSNSKITTDDADEAQQFQEFLRFKAFQQQIKQQATQSPTSSQDSSTDPFGGPCAQDPFDM
ncbi:hypothetical protein M9H77_22627 [Catharanthus roseus]|uniref:Uncharacterized protein n=1 Tax=Catharanthus roseus TaxID=4058 RepID=A0ACC0ARX4_CATRO|nr:hypothetical protein M9H77_22627 [Catharanthus roseus]